jgi:hypothetical protein
VLSTAESVLERHSIISRREMMIQEQISRAVDQLKDRCLHLSEWALFAANSHGELVALVTAATVAGIEGSPAAVSIALQASGMATEIAYRCREAWALRIAGVPESWIHVEVYPEEVLGLLDEVRGEIQERTKALDEAYAFFLGKAE